jgi:hypothetical protein
MSDSNNCIPNPFDDTAIFASDTFCTEEKEQLTEVSTIYGLRNSFESHPVISCWLGLKNWFTVLVGKAVVVLVAFSTTYLCEKTFSLTLI